MKFQVVGQEKLTLEAWDWLENGPKKQLSWYEQEILLCDAWYREENGPDEELPGY